MFFNNVLGPNVFKGRDKRGPLKHQNLKFKTRY